LNYSYNIFARVQSSIHRELGVQYELSGTGFVVEIPLLSTGSHVLKSKITHFDGHGSCDVASSKHSAHFPVSHPLQDYIVGASAPGEMVLGAQQSAFSFCGTFFSFRLRYLCFKIGQIRCLLAQCGIMQKT
jgi:hypothetical protein